MVAFHDGDLTAHRIINTDYAGKATHFLAKQILLVVFLRRYETSLSKYV